MGGIFASIYNSATYKKPEKKLISNTCIMSGHLGEAESIHAVKTLLGEGHVLDWLLPICTNTNIPKVLLW